jgi:hypothetical protein
VNYDPNRPPTSFTDQVTGGVKKLINGVPIIGPTITGTGAYGPADLTSLNADTAAAQQQRNQFSQQYANLKPTMAPQIHGTTIDTTQSNQARGVQGQGVGVQGQGIGVQQGAVGTQMQGVGAAQQGLGTQGEAAQSYRDVLSGGAPSVADLSAQRLAGQGIANQYGVANSATGANRAMALRAAINGAGGIATQTAADAGIRRAAEMDQARQGLLGAGSAMSGTGATLGNLGSGIANTGQGITQSGQGITASGTAIRGQDITGATNQANLTQQANEANQNAAVTTQGQNITQQLGIGSLANQATATPLNADVSKINAENYAKAAAQKNNNDLIATGADLLSDERVKTDVKPGAASAREMFAALLPKKFRYEGDIGPSTEGDQHLGVMAQDIEKSGKLGKGMVSESGGLKVINIPMAVSALMAAMADIERRGKRKAA